MKTTALSLAFAVVVNGSLFAQTTLPDFNVSVAVFLPVGMVMQNEVVGTPGAFYETYLYFGNPFLDPFDPSLLYLMTTGVVGPGGNDVKFFPLQIPGLILPEINGVTVVYDPTPIPTEIVALTLTTSPPPPPPPLPPPPCDKTDGAMTYDPELCILDLSGRVCPGDVITIKKNGVVIASVTAGPTGLGGIVKSACLGPGDVATAELNGAAWLGPIRR